MSAYTIVTTSAVQGGDTAEVNTLTDDFSNDSEALGYARRMADEMIDMANHRSDGKIFGYAGASFDELSNFPVSSYCQVLNRTEYPDA